jgi:hypothetical protein
MKLNELFWLSMALVHCFFEYGVEYFGSTKPGGEGVFTIWEGKLSNDSALDYSVHKYIYIYICLSAPYIITLL